MKFLLLLTIFLFLFPLFLGFAQDAPEEESLSAQLDEEEQISEASYIDSYIDMDIRTSSLSELAAWARELGLSEGGTRDDLAARLRSYYGIREGAGTEQTDQRIITIESARITEYFSLEIVDEEYARLRGDVIISLRDGNAIHRIQAWEILYNRTRNVMTASGGVEYIREEGDTIETFRGESITVNLDNWASIFVDGASERSVAGNLTAYRFAGTVISRNAEGVTVLTDAVITNPASEEAFWSLNAKKLWLLPGNDWAVLHAVLRVGNIPLLYVPFFFYPSDEIVFHPVLGYRTREGTFLQTTTYILGRPSSSSMAENSITRIFGGAEDGMETRREGIFLRSTGERSVSPNDTRLSLLFDAYVNMGTYLGMELVLPPRGIMGNIEVSAGLGLTRDVYAVGNAFTPFPELDGQSNWNRGFLFSWEIPLRYRFNMTGSLRLTNSRLSWSLPYYSDPYVNRDFLNRSEVMDWLAMIREGASRDADSLRTDTSITSFEWNLNSSFNPRLPSLAPYVSSLTIPNLSSSLQFNSRESRRYNDYLSLHPHLYLTPSNPGQAFFFPNRFNLYSISLSVAGTPYRSSSAPRQSAEAGQGETLPIENLLPDLPISPWEAPDPTEPGSGPAINFSDEFSLSPPALAQRFSLPTPGGPSFSLDYRLNPITASEMQFRSTADNWTEQDDINWNEVATVLSWLRGEGSLSFNVNHAGGGAYSGSFRVSGTGSWQDFVYLNEEAEEFLYPGGINIGETDPARIKAARDRTYRETFFTSSWNLTGSVRPFFQNDIWGNSNLQYNVSGLLGRTTVDTSGNDPQWEWRYGQLDRNDISEHLITANIAANIRDYNQNLTVSAVLPPRDALVSGNATLRAGISETSVRSQIRQPFDDDLRYFEPVFFTETLRFSWGQLRQYVVFDPEMNETTTVTTDVRVGGFTAAFSATYARPWKFNENWGPNNPGEVLWIQRDPGTNELFDEGLIPRELRFGYIHTFSKENLWKNRLGFSLSLNSGLSFDLQRYTNTRLNFGLGFRIGISKFLDLNITTNSENNMMFQYFQDIAAFGIPADLYPGQETNFFTDLVNSFRFDNNELRRRSGFKLRSVGVAATHYLGDWNATLTITTSPILDNRSFPPVYRFTNEISFMVQWIPISEIRTQIEHDRDRNITVR